MQAPLISALVVIYNPSDDINQTLDSLIDITQEIPFEVIVVDNGSSNELAQHLPSKFPQITFIHSEQNLGFGGGNNLAFARSSGDYIICVNPDLILSTDTVQKLIQVIEQSPDIGLVAPKTLDGDGTLAYTARADYTVARLSAKYLGISGLVRDWFYDGYRQKMEQETQPFSANWVQGSCMLMRRKTFAAVNGFDEKFFLYLEDADLCYRIRQQGLDIQYVPQAVVSHGGGSTTARFPYIRVKSYHHSPIHYHRKQGHTIGVWLLKAVFTIELSLKILIRSLQYRLNPNDALREHYRAEITVLRQLWMW